MDVIRPFIFYTNIFLNSFITVLGNVGSFMTFEAFSGHFHAVITVQYHIIGQGFVLWQIFKMPLLWEAAK